MAYNGHMREALSNTELKALELVKYSPVWVHVVPDKTEKDVWGDPIPGMAIYKKLDKKGLVSICEPFVDEDGFEWSASIDITPEGSKLV
jgi:hypothetical protein